jgi:hypothetical protein
MEIDKRQVSRNRDTWKTMLKIRNIILDNDGMIYGGFVRDSIIHDHFAQEFYKKYPYSSPQNYMNKECYPETWQRTSIPNDIDIFITENKFHDLIEILRRNHFEVKIVFRHDPRDYFPDIDMRADNTLLHSRLLVKPSVVKDVKRLLLSTSIDTIEIKNVLKNLSVPEIKIDVLTSLNDNIKEPFVSPLDFECNALYLTKGLNINVSSKLTGNISILDVQAKKNAIIEDIIQKRTRFMSPHNFRIRKMMNRGWMIYDSYITTIKETNYEGYCIICHENLDNTHIKCQCCDCRFHPQCLSSMIQSMKKDTCILCSAPCFLKKDLVGIMKEIQ